MFSQMIKPVVIPRYVIDILCYTTDELIDRAYKNYASLNRKDPVISIVIPAYNEEENILHTLFSLSATSSKLPLEIIVVNNNSKDRTEEYVTATGMMCVNEIKQGITNARNAGLTAAKGKYILNADSDTIYPPDWIDKMVSPLVEDKKVALTYGTFSFIPTGKTKRAFFVLYEMMADTLRWYRKHFKEEAVNVYGFNSGFRKEEGLMVNGFDHPPGTNEDGWLAMKLRDKYKGMLHLVSDPKALVWTKDRNLYRDGSIMNALSNRLKKTLKK